MCARIVAAGDFARAGKRRVEIDRRVEVPADETSLIGRAEFEPRVADRVAGRLAEARAHLNAVTNTVYGELKSRIARRIEERQRNPNETNAAPAAVLEK